MPLGSNPIRWPWSLQRKLLAISLIYSEGGVDMLDSASPLVVLEMLLDAELDRLREAGRVSGELERYIAQETPPS
jgi:hypothetical protein